MKKTTKKKSLTLVAPIIFIKNSEYLFANLYMSLIMTLVLDMIILIKGFNGPTTELAISLTIGPIACIIVGLISTLICSLFQEFSKKTAWHIYFTSLTQKCWGFFNLNIIKVHKIQRFKITNIHLIFHLIFFRKLFFLYLIQISHSHYLFLKLFCLFLPIHPTS